MVMLGPVRPGPNAADAPALPANYSNTEALGRLIYTDYVYPLQIAGVILLVAMVAAIALTLRQRKDAKYQDVSRQVKVRVSDRLRMVQDAILRPVPEVEPATTRPCDGRDAPESAPGRSATPAAASAGSPAADRRRRCGGMEAAMTITLAHYLTARARSCSRSAWSGSSSIAAT